jgi:pimeloyl-ACP methyl ester carboxylesterase
MPLFNQLKKIIWIALVLSFMVMTACQSEGDEQLTDEPLSNENGTKNSDDLTSTTVDTGGITAVSEPGKTYQEMIMNDETVIEYALVLPDNYMVGQSYPTLLALPPGDQTESMVEAGLSYWEAEAAERGWIVVSPIAPNFTLFFRGSESYIPEFLSRIGEQYRPEGGKFHVGGISNGGISAFSVAIGNPDLVHSVVVLPGYPLDGFDQDDLANLKEIPVAMFVGENDGAWVSRMETAEQTLLDLGAWVTLEIKAGEGHVIRSLSGEQLFDLLETFR